MQANHMEGHRFICGKCEKGFARHSDLVKHQATVHRPTPWHPSTMDSNRARPTSAPTTSKALDSMIMMNLETARLPVADMLKHTVPRPASPPTPRFKVRPGNPHRGKPPVPGQRGRPYPVNIFHNFPQVKKGESVLKPKMNPVATMDSILMPPPPTVDRPHNVIQLGLPGVTSQPSTSQASPPTITAPKPVKREGFLPCTSRKTTLPTPIPSGKKKSATVTRVLTPDEELEEMAAQIEMEADLLPTSPTSLFGEISDSSDSDSEEATPSPQPSTSRDNPDLTKEWINTLSLLNCAAKRLTNAPSLVITKTKVSKLLEITKMLIDLTD